MLRHIPACAVLLLVLASACSSGEGADTTPGSSVAVAETTSTSSPVAAEAREGESPLEGEWYDSNGSKMLVVRGDIAEFLYSRGPFTIDTDADPDQITLPPGAGQDTLTTIFRVDNGRLEVVLRGPTTPLPESFEAAAGDPESYSVLELFRADVVFASGVWTPAGHGLPPLYNVQDMTASGDSLIVGSTLSLPTLFISTDNGASWSQVGGGFPAEESVGALTTLEGRVFAGTQSQGVFISDDGGETWTASNEGLATPDADCAENPRSPHSQILDIAGFGSTVFVTSFCGVSRSDDLGETWRQLNEGLVSNNMGFLAVGDGIAYVSSQGALGVYRLDWEQDRWEPLGQAVGYATTLVESEGTLFLSSPNSGVWRSDDFGESWTDVTAPQFNGASDLVVVDGNIFAATAPQGVFWTEDAGNTWAPYNKDLVRYVSLLQVSGDRLFAAGGTPGVFSAPFPDQLPSQETAAVIPGEVPDGFEAFDGSANGFTIALPATWLTIDLTVGDKDSIAAELEAIFPPDFAETLSSSYVQNRKTAASGVGGMVLAAFDATGDPSLIVLVSPRESLDTLESEENMIQAGIEISEGSVQSVDRLELSGGEASRIVTLFSLETNDVELVQYVVLGDDTTYNITFSSSEPGAADTLLSQIINTFTLADT